LSAFRRGLIVIAVESFLTLLTALIFTVVASSHLVASSPPTSDVAATRTAVGDGVVGFLGVGIGVVIAIAIGMPALVIYAVTRPSASPPTVPPIAPAS
jgi:hypothetical protein